MKHDEREQFTSELNAPLDDMPAAVVDQQTIDSEMESFAAFASEASKF